MKVRLRLGGGAVRGWGQGPENPGPGCSAQIPGLLPLSLLPEPLDAAVGPGSGQRRACQPLPLANTMSGKKEHFIWKITYL
jgi:hypothetical protein